MANQQSGQDHEDVQLMFQKMGEKLGWFKTDDGGSVQSKMLKGSAKKYKKRVDEKAKAEANTGDGEAFHKTNSGATAGGIVNKEGRTLSNRPVIKSASKTPKTLTSFAAFLSSDSDSSDDLSAFTLSSKKKPLSGIKSTVNDIKPVSKQNDEPKLKPVHVIKLCSDSEEDEPKAVRPVDHVCADSFLECPRLSESPDFMLPQIRTSTSSLGCESSRNSGDGYNYTVVKDRESLASFCLDLDQLGKPLVESTRIHRRSSVTYKQILDISDDSISSSNGDSRKESLSPDQNRHDQHRGIYDDQLDNDPTLNLEALKLSDLSGEHKKEDSMYVTAIETSDATLDNTDVRENSLISNINTSCMERKGKLKKKTKTKKAASFEISDSSDSGEEIMVEVVDAFTQTNATSPLASPSNADDSFSHREKSGRYKPKPPSVYSEQTLQGISTQSTLDQDLIYNQQTCLSIDEVSRDNLRDSVHKTPVANYHCETLSEVTASTQSEPIDSNNCETILDSINHEYDNHTMESETVNTQVAKSVKVVNTQVAKSVEVDVYEEPTYVETVTITELEAERRDMESSDLVDDSSGLVNQQQQDVIKETEYESNEEADDSSHIHEQSDVSLQDLSKSYSEASSTKSCSSQDSELSEYEAMDAATQTAHEDDNVENNSEHHEITNQCLTEGSEANISDDASEVVDTSDVESSIAGVKSPLHNVELSFRDNESPINDRESLGQSYSGRGDGNDSVFYPNEDDIGASERMDESDSDVDNDCVSASKKKGNNSDTSTDSDVDSDTESLLDQKKKGDTKNGVGPRRKRGPQATSTEAEVSFAAIARTSNADIERDNHGNSSVGSKIDTTQSSWRSGRKYSSSGESSDEQDLEAFFQKLRKPVEVEKPSSPEKSMDDFIVSDDEDITSGEDDDGFYLRETQALENQPLTKRLQKTVPFPVNDDDDDVFTSNIFPTSVTKQKRKKVTKKQKKSQQKSWSLSSDSESSTGSPESYVWPTITGKTAAPDSARTGKDRGNGSSENVTSKKSNIHRAGTSKSRTGTDDGIPAKTPSKTRTNSTIPTTYAGEEQLFKTPNPIRRKPTGKNDGIFSSNKENRFLTPKSYNPSGFSSSDNSDSDDDCIIVGPSTPGSVSSRSTTSESSLEASSIKTPGPVTPSVTKKSRTPLVPRTTGTNLKTPTAALKTRPHTYTFLRSLSNTTEDGRRDPEARKFVSDFKKKKEQLSARLYEFYNTTVFEGKLPSDMTVTWNKRLLRTAGYCTYKKNVKNPEDRTTRIELSTKVCDSAERVRDTLIHEMCHAAVWLLNGVNGGHGPFWKYWAKLALRIHPELPSIKRCHSYSINFKFTYKCMSCGYSIGRHSKSLDMKKLVCGYCKGTFELLTTSTSATPGSSLGSASATPKTPRTPNRFALFVKDNYGSVKQTNKDLKHGDVMKELSKLFAASKINL